MNVFLNIEIFEKQYVHWQAWVLFTFYNGGQWNSRYAITSTAIHHPLRAFLKTLQTLSLEKVTRLIQAFEGGCDTFGIVPSNVDAEYALFFLNQISEETDEYSEKFSYFREFGKNITGRDE